MKAEIFYFTTKAFLDHPERYFTNAKSTIDQLNESGLKNFVKVDTYEINPTKEEHIDKLEFAELLYGLYNDGAFLGNPLGTKEGQEKIRSVGAGHTSMSINDFVVIDGDVLIVDQCGFKNIGQHDTVSEVLKN